MMPQTSTLPNPVSSLLLKARRIERSAPLHLLIDASLAGELLGARRSEEIPAAPEQGGRERNKDAQGSVAFWDGRELIVQQYSALSGNRGHFFHKMLISIDFMWKGTLAFRPFSL